VGAARMRDTVLRAEYVSPNPVMFIRRQPSPVVPYSAPVSCDVERHVHIPQLSKTAYESISPLKLPPLQLKT
jgi:hypothetical protein